MNLKLTLLSSSTALVKSQTPQTPASKSLNRPQHSFASASQRPIPTPPLPKARFSTGLAGDPDPPQVLIPPPAFSLLPSFLHQRLSNELPVRPSAFSILRLSSTALSLHCSGNFFFSGHLDTQPQAPVEYSSCPLHLASSYQVSTFSFPLVMPRHC